MRRFSYFVILADMRTGSNLLETALNALDDVSCHGELFNPHFVGAPGRQDAFGVTASARERDPVTLLDAMRAQTDGIPGFRLFHDHDARVRAHCLSDPDCAKIVLTRNVLDAYVSHKIAVATGQWKLTDAKHRKTARARFDAGEFDRFQRERAAYHTQVRNALQAVGQTAYQMTYEDLQSAGALNGLAIYLGAQDRLHRMPRALKKQNPANLRDKVQNYDQMIEALGKADRWDLSHDAIFEPPRGPALPTVHLAATVRILFVPFAGAPEASVLDWLGAVNGGALQTGLRQRDMRKWMRTHPGHLSFAVVRHPVWRAWSVFHAGFADPGHVLPETRQTLRHRYGLSLPDGSPSDPVALRAAWLTFLNFLVGHLTGQSSLPNVPDWATQAAILSGVAGWRTPDRVIHESDLTVELAHLAKLRGLEAPAFVPELPPGILSEIYDAEVEQAVRKAYARDYMTFGFGDWAP